MALHLELPGKLRQDLADALIAILKLAEIAELSDVIENRFEDNWEVPVVLSVNQHAVIGDILERALSILRSSTHNEEIIGAMSESLDLIIYLMSYNGFDLEALQYAGLGKLQKNAENVSSR